MPDKEGIMYNLLTVSDSKYLAQGKALIDSLRGRERITLYYFCIDLGAARDLYEYQGPENVNVVPVFVNNYMELQNVSNNSYKEYCWSLSARCMQFCKDRYGIKEMVYVDTDVWFLRSLDVLFDEARGGNYKLGLVPHCHFSKYAGPGGYNCGIVYYNDAPEILDTWVDCIANPSKYPTPDEYLKNYGFRFDMHACGDQTPLVYLMDRFGCQTFHTFLQGAPWNGHCCDWSRLTTDTTAFLKDRFDDITGDFPLDFMPVLAWHFSGFEFNKETFSATRERFNEEFLKDENVRTLYLSYYNKLKTFID